MKRALIVTALAALPMTAHAGGWGVTHYQSNEWSASAPLGTKGYTSTMHRLPSIDVRASGFIIQIDALETIAGLFRTEVDWEGEDANAVHLGVNVYKTSMKKPITGTWDAVVQPGGSIDIDSNNSFDPSELAILGGARIGAQAMKKAGFGIYIVPEIGFASTYDYAEFDSDGNPEKSGELAVGGQLQISVWFSNK